ncbi:MAG: hypothetical protein PVI00_15075 [Desulfobacterales bacterium]
MIKKVFTGRSQNNARQSQENQNQSHHGQAHQARSSAQAGRI